jgi:hypothetical protein
VADALIGFEQAGRRLLDLGPAPRVSGETPEERLAALNELWANVGDLQRPSYAAIEKLFDPKALTFEKFVALCGRISGRRGEPTPEQLAKLKERWARIERRIKEHQG